MKISLATIFSDQPSARYTESAPSETRKVIYTTLKQLLSENLLPFISLAKDSGLVAQGLSKVPQTLSKIEQGLGKVPQTLSKVPQGLSKVPQTLGKVPQGLSKVPQTLSKVPQGLGKVPKTLGSSKNGVFRIILIKFIV